MNIEEECIVGAFVLTPWHVKKYPDFEPADFELRDLYHVISKWADENKHDIENSDSLCVAIDAAGHNDLVADLLNRVDPVPEKLDAYYESWCEL